MTILVAGGAGFIGSHLCDLLLSNGNNVIIADKLIFGDKNIRHLLNDKNLNAAGRIKFYKVDLAIQDNVDKIFNENSVDAVYHLAANSDIQKGSTDTSIDFNDTFMTTRSILEGMRKANVKQLFFASTSAVYGEMTNIDLNEKTGGIMPVSFYGGAKLASESFISSYSSMCDMKVVIFRFPNVIGPRLTHGVIFDFIRKLRKDSSKLEILGDGKQCKPYIYVLDLVQAIVRLTNTFSTGVELYNVGVLGGGTTVTRIAEIVVSQMKLQNVEFVYTGGDRGWKGDVPRFSYDISKVLATGWKPTHTSDEAVLQTVNDAIKAGI